MNKIENPFHTPGQLDMRALIEQLSREEMPLGGEQLRALAHFVKVVRTEIVERQSKPPIMMTMPDGREVEVTPRTLGGIGRVNYYMLNDLGLRLKFDWERGLLDKYIE